MTEKLFKQQLHIPIDLAKNIIIQCKDKVGGSIIIYLINTKLLTDTIQDMKLKFNVVFLIILIPTFTFCQKELAKEQVLEDYTVLKNVLEGAHPNLYQYTSESQWDSLFIDFETKKVQTIKTSNDLYTSITKLTDYVKDGHLIVMRPQLDSIPKLFPLLLKIVNGKFYTDTDDFGIPVGSEIISIDGIQKTELRKRLLMYAPTDGYNTTKKDRQIEREFSILHYYEFGAKPFYEIEYKTPSNTILTKNIESQDFESIGKRFVNRNSYFSRYHKSDNTADYIKNTIGKIEPFIYVVDSVNTAVLTINSFNIDVERYQSTLKKIFKEIQRKKVENLIIDIRQNEGGYPLNAIHTFSYITQKPFKQRESSKVITSTLPEKQYSQNLVNGYTYDTFFKKYYQNAEKHEKGWISLTDENEPFMIPNKKGFEGEVYVLIGGKTFSAGSSFALFCKNAGIPLIGEETGGGYYTQTGGYPIIYTLPHSEIKILISFVNITRFVNDTTVKKGSGVLPDIPVSLSVQNLIEGKDSQLDYILSQIKKK